MSTDDISDLPPALLKNLTPHFLQKGGRSPDRAERIVRLVGEKTMTVDEILIAIWYDNGDLPTRKSIHQSLMYLVKKGALTRPHRGKYALAAEGQTQEETNR